MITKPLVRSHVLNAIRFSNETLGEGYITEDYLDGCMASNNHIVLGVYEHDRLVGFGIGEVATEYLGLQTSGNIGVIRTIAVNPLCQRKGYGYYLTQQISLLLTKRCTLLASMAWEHDGHVPMERIFKGLNYHLKQELHLYWYLDSIINGYQCPTCGNPCYCSGIVYVKRVGEVQNVQN